MKNQLILLAVAFVGKGKTRKRASHKEPLNPLPAIESEEKDSEV